MSTLTREAITMGTGDGAVDSHDDDEENDNRAEEGDEEKPVEEDEDAEQLKRRTAAATAALLGRKRGSRGGVRAVKPLKMTSVGNRRVGSATRARASQSGASKIMDAVRNVAGAAAASASSENTNTNAKLSESQKNSTSSTSSTQMGGSVIQATITSLLEGQNAFKKKADEDGDSLSMNAFPRPFGLLGEQPDPLSHELLRHPMPGTLLLYATIETQEYRRPSRETLSVRVATPDDDMQIANLRLSVFSDFSSELRSQFCARSCQVLADRRLRGATCLVATCPSGRNSPSDIILGSVECSVHEFFATKLGRRRPKYSTLYITEVAVSPSARRCGVGSKLLQVRRCKSSCTHFHSCFISSLTGAFFLILCRALTSLHNCETLRACTFMLMCSILVPSNFTEKPDIAKYTTQILCMRNSQPH
jgi:ribosomal protein S18 acetylase RimI-like enzyme